MDNALYNSHVFLIKQCISLIILIEKYYLQSVSNSTLLRKTEILWEWCYRNRYKHRYRVKP